MEKVLLSGLSKAAGSYVVYGDMYCTVKYLTFFAYLKSFTY